MGVVAPPLRTERRLVLSVLVALSAVGWAVVVWQAAGMDDHGMEGTMGLDLTMGMEAPLFVLMWTVMMAAMMFPASAPMILAFSRSQSSKREAGAPFVPTWVFVAPYLAVWAVFGAVGYGAAVLADSVLGDSRSAMEDLSRAAGVLVVAAGIYQLTPLKRVCLSKCRTPLSFMLSYWRDGRWGAAAMGLRHGLFCLGCCWALFVVLIPLGVMNIGAMLALAALVFAEKALPRGEAIARVAAVVLIGYGLVAVAVPSALPTAV